MSTRQRENRNNGNQKSSGEEAGEEGSQKSSKEEVSKQHNRQHTRGTPKASPEVFLRQIVGHDERRRKQRFGAVMCAGEGSGVGFAGSGKRFSNPGANRACASLGRNTLQFEDAGEREVCASLLTKVVVGHATF
jgi:hypothetical protein